MSDPNMPSGQPDPFAGTPFAGIFGDQSQVIPPALLSSEPSGVSQPATPALNIEDLQKVQEAISPLFEMIGGIRQQFIAQGFGPEVADQLTASTWMMMMKTGGLL
jgi:hypothetical protein